MIVAHWKLNDNLATDVVIDETGVNNGTLSDAGGTATTAFHSVKGIVDRAQLFDGDDDNITVAADPTIDANGKTALTISAWINPASDGENDLGRVVDKANVGGTVGYFMPVSNEDVDAPNTVRISTIIGHDGAADMNVSAAGIVLDKWTHIGFTYNEDGDKKGKLYFNGVLQSRLTDTAGIGTIDDDSAETLIIGNSSANTRTFDGLIDNVTIYDNALSASDVLQLYQDGAVPFFRSRYSGNSAVRLPRRRFSPNSSF